jgi:ElaB/YqjD/DUF883 family membrane-anchored ribosome-binding protein
MADEPTPARKPAGRKPVARKAPSPKPASPTALARKAAPAKPAATRAAPTAKPARKAAAPKTASSSAKLKSAAGDATAAVRKEASALKDQAAARARGAATEGKARAASALDNVARLITDAAGTVDDKVGAQYGDYTRKAAEAVSGFADTLKGKDVDALVRDATDFVKKSPAVAIGAAAAIGFVLARLVKAGTDDNGKA